MPFFNFTSINSEKKRKAKVLSLLTFKLSKSHILIKKILFLKEINGKIYGTGPIC